jgi:hypothetical protein
MYQFSRSIYRELAPRVVEDPNDPTGCASQQRLLDACETTIRRLTYDRPYFAHPARFLFGEVRAMFSLNDQLFVWRVIDGHVALAHSCLERMSVELGLEPKRCRAETRKGTPCQRPAADGADYCPTHRHLDPVLPTLRPAPQGATVG